METKPENIENKGGNDQPQGAPSKDKEEGGVVTHLGEKEPEKPINPIQTPIPPEPFEKKEDTERRRIKKELFLTYFEKTICLVYESAEKAGIHPDTHYEWYKKDPEYKQKYDAILAREADMIESRLKRAILTNDIGAIKFWLDRRDPRYKRNIKVETHITGDITLDMLLKGDDEDVEEQQKLYDKETREKNEQGTDRGVIQDSKQEGTISPVQVQPSSELLLEKKDEKKSNSESTTKGNLESHRRGPAPRVHEERH